MKYKFVNHNYGNRKPKSYWDLRFDYYKKIGFAKMWKWYCEENHKITAIKY